MNRLILLGNGFDLAHGLRTSYNDFILWYLITSIEEAQKNGEYNDDILTIKKNPNYLTPFSGDISLLVTSLYSTDGLARLFSNDVHSYQRNGFEHSISVRITVHTDFMRSLFNDCSIQNWVDIENKYYEALKEVLDLDYLKAIKTNEKDHLRQLNDTMEVLTSNLQRYLKTQETRNTALGIDRIFGLDINESEFVHWSKVENKALEKTLILNFNYTPTVENYTLINRNSNEEIKVNYIHGQLNYEQNPLIFGFGDELDDNYKRIEEHPTKGLFRHIKSFGYFKTRNYHDLIRYIESGQYQVFILGHSCGLSDRTMLNMIFEHDNCMSIKIYYYQSDEKSNNYTDLTEEISRHFKSKTKMRERIVCFEDSQRIPQLY